MPPPSDLQTGSSRRPSTDDESRIDARRYLAAIRRSRNLIIAIVLGVTVTVVVVSMLLPKTYQAETTLVLDVNDPVIGVSDTETVIRQLQTLDAQVDSLPVRTAVADELGLASPDDLEGQIDSAVDPEANLITISATDRDPADAAEIANTVADEFIKLDSERQRESLRTQLRQANAQLAQAGPGEAQAVEDQIGALRAQISSQSTELTVIEAAEVPDSPHSPRPLRNGILAFFAALFLGLIIALVRDQLKPGITSARELSRMTGLPILAALPYVGTRFTRNQKITSAIEHEAYQSLAAGLRLTLPPGSGRIILITSSVHGEGKTTVASRVGRMLAQSGSRTLLISADLRWPRMHELFDLDVEPGLSEVLSHAATSGVDPGLIPAAAHKVMERRTGAELSVLTSGGKPRDPATLLGSQVAKELFESVRGLDFDYVIIDGPPILGIADIQALARIADDLILVSRLDRITVENLTDAIEFLDRQPIEKLGHVVIGSSVDVSPYYLSARRSDGLPGEPIQPGRG